MWKEGISIDVESYDKMANAEHDLTRDEPFGSILNKAKNQNYDGGHAGFPCGSFSRARLNAAGDGPGPVRSGVEIYGLSTNSKRQQQEADRGTVLAVRSAMVVGEIIMGRAVPTVGTLENRPGSQTKEEGPAWELPELKIFEDKLKATTALFNTCAFQHKEKIRWFKPGRITVCLADLTSLSRKCSCPSWIVHQSLIGKDLTAKAAEYPQELVQAYAVLAVKAFKVTLQMEWWRHQLKVKKEEVTAAQKSWLVSKMKNQLPPTNLGELSSSKRAWTAENVDEDVKPTEGPSKKARREGERPLRGRHEKPGQGGGKTPRALRDETGKDIRRLWTRSAKDHPKVMETASNYGGEHCELDMDARGLENGDRALLGGQGI